MKEKASVRVVIDGSLLADPTAPLVFRAFSGEASVSVSSMDFQKFLNSTGASFESFDFGSLGAKAAAPSPAALSPKDSSKKDAEKEVQMGIMVKKDEDFPTWYSQVLTKTEMLDYYDISGCYILRPWAHSIWKRIQGASFFSNYARLANSFRPQNSLEGKSKI